MFSKTWKFVTVCAAIGWGATAAQAEPLVLDTGGVLQPVAPRISNLQPVATQPSRLGTFNIQINAGSTLASNQAALDSFNRAARQWIDRIADPFTVFINADLGSFNEPGVIGAASSVTLEGAFDTIRNQMVTDALDEADDAIVAALPTNATFNASLPAGGTRSGNLRLNKANAKALGFTGLDAAFGMSDGMITFNNAFGFDFDNRDGVGAGLIDFETVAAHEIGHVLGFVSIVDDINAGDITDITPYTFDLFRFENNVIGSDPMAVADFTTATRFLRSGGDAIFDDTLNEFRLSTGLNAPGDGRQASHFKDGDLTGVIIGVLDPTLAAQQVIRVSDSDARVMDLIGYEIVSVTAVPEPGTVTLMGLGIVGLIGARRRKKKEQQ